MQMQTSGPVQTNVPSKLCVHTQIVR